MTGGDLLLAAVGTVLLAVVARLVTRRFPLGVVPSAVVGGGLALTLRQLGWLPGSVAAWQDVAYHLFGISFLAIGLTAGDAPRAETRLGAAWMGVGQMVTFSLQAAVGVIVAWLFVQGGFDLDAAFGLIAPMGLNEGPGQALSIGRLWEEEGLADVVPAGITIASLGFVVAYLGGLLVGRLHRSTQHGPTQHGPTQHGPAQHGPTHDGWSYRPAPPPASPPSTSSTSTSTSTSTSSSATGAGRVPVAAIVADVVGYAVVYLVVRWVTGLIGPGVQDLVLGVLFFVALAIGIGVRVVLARAGRRVAPEPQRRVSALAVEGLTVAILGGLAWADVARVIWPVLTVLVACAAVSAAAIAAAARSLPEHAVERGLTMFGTVTGTAASGLALLAIVDPELDTPVATELGGAIIISAPTVIAGVALSSAVVVGAVPVAVAVAVFLTAALVAVFLLRVIARRMASRPM